MASKNGVNLGCLTVLVMALKKEANLGFETFLELAPLKD